MPLQSIESLNGFCNLLPGFKATLMTLARYAELSNWKIVLYWLSTPSSVLHNWLKPIQRPLRFSLSTLCPPRWTFSHDLSLVFRALPFLPQPQKRLALLRFFLPIARNSSSLLIWVYLSQYVPLLGFLNLLAICSSNCPVALFHATSTCGIPLQSFPLESSISPSSGLIPLYKMYYFSAHICRRICEQIVKHHEPESTCGLTNTPITGC